MESPPQSAHKQEASPNETSSPSSSSDDEKSTPAPAAIPQADEKSTAISSSPAVIPLANLDSAQAHESSIKDELFRLQFVMPEYLRVAMVAAVESKLVDYPGTAAPMQPQTAPIHPLVVMINSRSGGRKGPALQALLNDLLSKEQVFDLLVTPPKDFIRYGLGALERLAELGDQCAKDTRNNLRILVAGGDGTVGWVLGSLTELHLEKRPPIPPVGIIPLGTGNDLARSFGWGGAFRFAWKPFVRRYLYKARGNQTAELDSWQVAVRTSTKEEVKFPHALHPQHRIPLPEGDGSESSNEDTAGSFEGVFYNYFSIGMDAQVAYGFHHLRESKPHIARGPVSNKLVYSGYSCAQGWFFTPCSASPHVRGLRNVMRLKVKRDPAGEWEPVDLPHNVRAVVMLNLQSYASGRNPWGHPPEEYNQKKSFVPPSYNDGRLEIFGLFDGWHASLVMLSLRSAKRLAQGCAAKMQLVADMRHRVYMQMDGEPWKQPLSEDENSTIIEVSPVPTRSVMLQAS